MRSEPSSLPDRRTDSPARPSLSAQGRRAAKPEVAAPTTSKQKPGAGKTSPATAQQRPAAAAKSKTKSPATAKDPSARGAKQAAKSLGEKPTAGRRVAAVQPAARRGRAAEQERITQILDGLDQLYPDAHCELDFRSPFELLIAVILSAQCTDDRVNLVTPELFRRYPDPQALAKSDPEEVERIIYSTGFYRNKAKNIRLAAQKIVEKFGGAVPRTMAELLTLPGVARKTANVVLGTAYGIPSGVVVDTHVTRLSQRLGLTRHDDAVKIEDDLTAKWPKERWIMGAHRLIWHGRRVCNARKPGCDRCSLAPLCPSVELS